MSYPIISTYHTKHSDSRAPAPTGHTLGAEENGTMFQVLPVAERQGHSTSVLISVLNVASLLPGWILPSKHYRLTEGT